MEKNVAEAEIEAWVKIDEGVFRLRHSSPRGMMGYSPYLLIDGNEAALIDPGASIHSSEIFDAIGKLIPPDRISLMIAHHQDPDICGAIPELSRLGVSAPVALHWRTSTLAVYYGISGPFYLVNENKWEWSFASGRKLKFIPAPYCHFAGSIMTWDEKTGILFSGDLFGALSDVGETFADASYREPMKAFHEHYMPSREILAPVMDSILSLDIKQIAPQHGKVIRDDVRGCAMELRSLRCGSYLGNTEAVNVCRSPYSEKDESLIVERLIARLALLFGRERTRLALERIKETGEGGKAMGLSDFLAALVATQGPRWFSVIEPYLYSLLDEFRVALPDCIRQTAEIPIPEPLSDSGTPGQYARDRNTGLWDGSAFRKRLGSVLAERDGKEFALIYFSVDNLEEINQLHGRHAGDDAIRGLAYLAQNASTDPGWSAYKLAAPYVAVIADGFGKEATRSTVERIRYEAAEAKFSTERLTVSAGILYGDALRAQAEANGANNREEIPNAADKLLLARLFSARRNASGGICDVLTDGASDYYLKKRILLVEPDDSYVRFLEPLFAAKGYFLVTVPDGASVDMNRAEEIPDIVIAEAMTPRMGGFDLRRQMLNSVRGKRIPFILISRRKDEEFIKRARDLGIVYFLKKPFSKTELIGLVDNLIGAT